MATVAEFLRSEMASRGWSQSEMGRRIGVYPEYVRRWLAGEVPRPEKCGMIAKGLGLPISMVMLYLTNTVGQG
jgi:transcriptional regulator with XRE-family HTH domain